MNKESSSKIILLADDDVDDAEMFIDVMSRIDATVQLHHVKDGLSVLQHLNSETNNKPDIIFLDINMPELTGWQCLTSLKSNAITKNIPVIMYSTSAHPRDKQKAIELGASAFITKPSDYKLLQKILTEIAEYIHSDLKTAISSIQQVTAL